MTVNNIMEKIAELMGAHGMSVEKLAHATNIPVRFVSALKNGEFSKLPAEPYVRGYLVKIAHVLKADPDELMGAYKESASSSKSGQYDKLPANRFQKVVFTRGIAVAFAVIMLIGAFFFFRLEEILGFTGLDVQIPAATAQELFRVSGSVRPGYLVTLNDEIVYTDEQGHFEKDMMLEAGLNNLEFKVKRFLGRETTIVKQIYYEPIIQTIPTTNTNG